MKHDIDKVMDTLYKKALGYEVQEVVEEYGGEQSNELLKKKVTKKPIAPDVTALKTYLELKEGMGEFKTMSDEQLLNEKQRLLNELAETQQNAEQRKDNER